MEMIEEKDWENGEIGNVDKRRKILEIYKEIGRNGLSMKEISKRSKIKWVYSEVKKMVDKKILEEKKFGRKLMYRKVK